MLRRFLLPTLTSFIQSMVKPSGLPWESGGGGAPVDTTRNRITEAGDTRTTEAGDTRVVES